MNVFIFGAGKVGVALHRAARRARLRCTLRAARAGLPDDLSGYELVIVAVRDGGIAAVAAELAARRLLSRSAVVVHVAGAQSAEALAAARGACAGVAQLHPMIAFADLAFAPSLQGGHAHVQGDPAAVKVARRFAAAVGLRPRTFPALDPVLYHAAAGLVANGAAALAAAGTEVLERAGVPREKAPLLLGPLLCSVAENVEALGLPGALTGPVRRGDAAAVDRHLTMLARLGPHLAGLYAAMADAQLPLARALGDAPAAAFDAVADVVGRHARE